MDMYSMALKNCLTAAEKVDFALLSSTVTYDHWGSTTLRIKICLVSAVS